MLGSTLKVQFQPGNWRRTPLCVRRRPIMLQLWLHYTPRTICSYAKYHYTKLGHMVVMKSWNAGVEQRQRYLAWAESFYIMSVWNSLAYLMLLSQKRVPIICIVKFRINNKVFTIKGSFKGHSNWNIDLITPSGYETNICMFYLSCFGRQCYHLNDLVIYTQAKFQHPTTFGFWDIAFRI